MWAYPGKKLLFMGQEFAQGREWNFDAALDWPLLDVDWHRGMQSLVRDCNRAYRAIRSLHERDCEPDGFRWIEVNDRDRSVFAWLRQGGDGAPPLVAIVNFTPVPREGYRIGLPLPGRWREILNTDAAVYGGTDCGNCGGVDAASRREPRLRELRERRAAAARRALARARRRFMMPHGRSRRARGPEAMRWTRSRTRRRSRARRWPTCSPAGAARGSWS